MLWHLVQQSLPRIETTPNQTAFRTRNPWYLAQPPELNSHLALAQIAFSYSASLVAVGLTATHLPVLRTLATSRQASLQALVRIRSDLLTLFDHLEDCITPMGPWLLLQLVSSHLCE